MYVIGLKFLAKFPAFPVQGSIELMWQDTYLAQQPNSKTSI